MKTLKKYAVFAIVFIFYGCPHELVEDYFRFENNSEHDVFVYLSKAGREHGSTLYPDTALMDSNLTIGPVYKTKILGYSFQRYMTTDTLCFFIIDADTMQKYSWDEIKDGYKILQRYDLDVTDEGLRNINFKVRYPPTEEMKHIQMFPSYHPRN